MSGPLYCCLGRLWQIFRWNFRIRTRISSPHQILPFQINLFFSVADTRRSSGHAADGVHGHPGPDYVYSMNWVTCSFMCLPFQITLAPKSPSPNCRLMGVSANAIESKSELGTKNGSKMGQKCVFLKMILDHVGCLNK